MPREVPGESKQAYIIALVFFVLIAIVLGVFTWLGYNGQAKLEADRKKAEDEKTAITKDRDTVKAQLAALKLAVGIGTKDDVGDAQGGNKEAADSLVTTNLKQVRWDANQSKPVKSLLDLLKTAEEDARKMTSGMHDTEEKAKAEAANYENLLQQNRQKQAKLEAELRKANEEIKRVQDSKTVAFKDQSETVAKQMDRLTRLQKEMQDQKDECDKLRDKLLKQIKDLQLNYDRLAKQNSKVEDYVAYEKPLGKVVAIDPRGGYAYINLGSADNVKQQLTFSVFSGTESYRAGREPKASVEVVRVIAPHESEVRVTDVRDPGRDPIVRGDPIYNPAWNPNLKQHIAIAGVVDLTGDGRDSSAELRRNLEKQNIVIDAWLDVRTAQVHGEITRETSYLITGELPKLDETAGLAAAEDINKTKRELNLKQGEMIKTAEQKGVTVLPVRRFLLLIGYPMPRNVATPDYVMPGVREPGSPGEAGGAPPAPAPGGAKKGKNGDTGDEEAAPQPKKDVKPKAKPKKDEDDDTKE